MSFMLGNNTGYYIEAGNLKRQGLELEMTGKLLKNMDVVMGYSYMDAGYHDSPYYHEGSELMNTAKHAVNGWLNNTFFDGLFINMTLNVKACYRYQNLLLQLFVNNLLDSKGYTAYYRGGYLNPIDPRNVAVALNYQF